MVEDGELQPYTVGHSCVSFHRLYRTLYTEGALADFTLTFQFAMQSQDDQKPVPAAVGEDFTVEDQTFHLEEVAFFQARQRAKQAEQRRLRDLAEVAMMMDVWTRSENTAYAAVLEAKNETIRRLEEKMAKLSSLANRCASAIIHMQGYMEIVAPYHPTSYDIVPTTDPDMLFNLVIQDNVVDLTSDDDLSDVDDFMTQLMDM